MIMNTIQITIENLKCHGCAATIRKEVGKINGVVEITVNHDQSVVIIHYEGDEMVIRACKEKLRKLGYPEAGGNTALSKAKSYVSCAIGRISGSD